MIVLGVGIDIVKIARIKKTFDKFGDRFLKRALHGSEIEAFQSQFKRNPNRAISFLAGRWAAKEATYKALTTSCHSRKNNLNVNSNDVNFKNSSPRFPFTDLKVTSNPTQMNIEGFTKQFIQTLLFSNNNNDNNNNNKNVEKESWNVLISISHEDEYAIATATLQSLD